MDPELHKGNSNIWWGGGYELTNPKRAKGNAQVSKGTSKSPNPTGPPEALDSSQSITSPQRPGDVPRHIPSTRVRDKLRP